MTLIWQSIVDSLLLIVRFDNDVFDAASRSLFVSAVAVSIASLLGVPLGVGLARTKSSARTAIVFLLRSCMSLPTVFIGVMCYSIFSRRGPLGSLEILYTSWAIVVGEIVLALPIVASLTHAAIHSLDPLVGETARTLGANRFRRTLTYLSEARVGVTLAVLTAFSRCVTELGIAMMVGGNLKGRTRTLATATAEETSKGEFSRAMAMGLILLVLAMGVTFLIVWLGRDVESDA